MALYLISTDVKLKAALDRQLEKGSHWINSTTKLKEFKTEIALDHCPVLLIDESFSEKGIFPPLEILLVSQIPGSKVLLTSKLNYSKNDAFLYHEKLGILRKPFSLNKLIEGLVAYGKIDALIDHLSASSLALLKKEHQGISNSHLIGNTSSIKQVRKIVEKIALKFSSVHINGETGTGKEVVANMLREKSQNCGPFVVVNCSAIPGSLADTYLFGYDKGAYTDAKEGRLGVVKAADKGILFLDEIEDLALEVQGKLLRLLETHQFRAVGSDSVQYSHFCLITASNVPLKELCDQNRLRFDLYNRLNNLVINIPPLREHKSDIPLLIKHHQTSRQEKREIDLETMKLIMEYDWPGNVRELFKELDLLSVFAPSEGNRLSFREILTESALLERNKPI